MQVTTTTPAPTPQAPPTVRPAPVTITFTDVGGQTQVLTVPMTRQDVRNLHARRQELSDQLSSATSRRHRLSEEIRSAPLGASRTGLEERLTVLDKRIVQLESDIAATGRQLSAAPAGLAATTGAGGDFGVENNVAAISVAFTIFVMFPLAIALARTIWKRASRAPSAAAQLPPQVDQRLERIEQGMEAIAIEIERVTEGQRFVTKLLSEQTSRERLSERVPGS